MDRWVHDENLFISRKLGSALGVVQVYRCWSLDAPMVDNSFSLLGETSSPSERAPGTVWGQRDYLRLIEFLEVNSAMVNVRGHVILRSSVKSLRVGRADGPATYWRCLDVVPVHAFGLVRPVDTHGTPQFLIVGGDVVDSVTPGKVIADAEFDQLKLEVSTLKDTLAGVNTALTESQTENKKLVREIEDQKSANKQKQTTLKDVEEERDTVKASLTACQTENTKLVKENENKKSINKQLAARIREVDNERRKASQEVEKLKIQVSESVTKSVLNDRLEKTRDSWASFVAYQFLDGCCNTPLSSFRSANELPSNRNGNAGIDLSNYHKIYDFCYTGNWIAYRNGNKVTITLDGRDPSNDKALLWDLQKIQWENANKTGRLYGSIEMPPEFYN